MGPVSNGFSVSGEVVCAECGWSELLMRLGSLVFDDGMEMSVSGELEPVDMVFGLERGLAVDLAILWLADIPGDLDELTMQPLQLRCNRIVIISMLYWIQISKLP